MKPVFSTIWKVVKNKYFIATAIFLAIICFLDDTNLLVAHRLRRDVSQLEKQAKELRENIVQDSIQAVTLKYDRAAQERFGREQYYMKSEDEDIYIIVDKEK